MLLNKSTERMIHSFHKENQNISLFIYFVHESNFPTSFDFCFNISPLPEVSVQCILLIFQRESSHEYIVKLWSSPKIFALKSGENKNNKKPGIL